MNNTNDGNSRPSKQETHEPAVPDGPHPTSHRLIPHTLDEFRLFEGKAREARLQALWNRLPRLRGPETSPKTLPMVGAEKLTPETAEKLKEMYDNELLGRCGGYKTGSPAHPIGWKAFKAYAETKEVGTC